MKTTTWHLATLVSLSVLVLTPTADVTAQERRWRMTLDDMTVREDVYFDSVGADHVYVHDERMSSDSIALMSILRVEERVPGDIGLEWVIGAIAGAGLGFGVGMAGGDINGHGCCPATMIAIPLGIVGLIAGSVIGGGIASSADVTATDIDFSNMTREQREWTVRHRVLR